MKIINAVKIKENTRFFTNKLSVELEKCLEIRFLEKSNKIVGCRHEKNERSEKIPFAASRSFGICHKKNPRILRRKNAGFLHKN